jgi:hypothetical protein
VVVAARSAVKWLVAGVLCLLVGFGLLLGVAFPWLIGEEAFRDSVAAALGRELRYASFDLEYFPPRIILEAPTLGGVDVTARSDRAVLNVSLIPMLARIVLVDSAEIEGAVVHVLRSGDGVRLTSELADAGTGAASRNRASMRFAVRALTIPSARLVFEDRTVSPPLRWELRDATLELQMDAFELRPRFAIAGEIATGGRVAAEGEVKESGAVDAEVRLDAVLIAPGRAYFASEVEFDGALTGRITASGPHVEFDLDLSDGRLTLGQIDLRGRLKITGKIDRETRPSQGLVEVDATAAELQFGDVFTKPPGTRGLVRGQVKSDLKGALTIDAWKFEMDEFEGRV